MAVALLTVLAGALRFTGLGTQSLWFDETLTAVILDPSLADTFETLQDREATPPLYYALVWVWTQAFGEGDVTLRSLSALFGTATVPAAYLAGMRLASQRTGIIAAALVATSPYLIWYSQEARAYALAMLLAALSLAFLAGTLDGRRRDLILWTVTVSLLLATHYFSAILIAAEALWLLRRRGLERATLAAFAAPTATGLLLAPLALSQEHADWIADLGFQGRLDETPRFFVGGFGGAPGSGLGLAAGLLATAGIVLLFWRTREREREGGLVALGIAALAVAISLALAAVGLDYVYHRNFLVLWIPIAVAVAAGYAAVRSTGIVVAVLLCCVFLASHIGIARDDDRHREDWQSAVEELPPADAPRPTAIWPPYADAPVVHYGIPLMEKLGSVHTTEIAVIGRYMDATRLEPGRRIGPFRVVERSDHHSITTAILRAEEPQTVELGPIDHGENLGAPQFHVYLDPGPTG